MEVAANVAALIQAAHKLYEIAHDIKHAPQEQADILESIQGIELLLNRIDDRQTRARKNPADPWYQGLLALGTSAATTANGKALVPDPTRKSDGAFVRLNKAFASLEIELPRKHGFAGFKQRAFWTHDKKKIKDHVALLDQLRSHVDSVLQQDHFELSEAILALNRDILTKGTDTNQRVQEVQAQNAEQANRVVGLVDSTANIETSVQGVRIAIDESGARIKRLEAADALKEQREERRAIIEWLSPLQFLRRQSDIFNDAILMGQKFLESEEFQAWSKGQPWILYGYGMPGSGKTVLSSIVVDQLRKHLKPAGVPVLCMYLNYKERNQTLTNLIGSLLKQLIQFEDDDFRSPQVKKLFREAAREASPLLNELYEALRAEIMTFSRVVLVVDALDELPSLESELLSKLYDLSNAGLSVMITSRPRNDIATEYIMCSNCSKRPLKLYHHCNICDGGQFDLCQTCLNKGIYCHDRSHELVQPMDEVAIDIEPTDEEIKLYVERELSKELKLGNVTTRDQRVRSLKRGTTRLGRFCQQMPELQTMIPQYIQASCNGMFMLAKLFMTAIKAKSSAEEVRDALSNLPKDYDTAYKVTMERIEHATLTNPNDTTSSLAKRTLMWVASSYRALSLAELQEALAIDLDRPEFRMLYPYDKQTLLDATLGLLYIDSDEKHVRLCHATAQEYFDQSRETWFPGAASQIARCCLQYLDRPDFAAPVEGLREDEEFEKRIAKYPFLQYACSFWGDHAGEVGQDENVHEAAIRYLDDTGKVDAFIQAAWYLNSDSTENWDVRKGANGLHIAAWFGLTGTIPLLLQRGLDINSEDPANGQTPLMFACRRGHAATVSLLLEHDASAETHNHSGGTALFEAVVHDRVDVVAVLLQAPALNINEEHLHNAERTPLMFAAKDNYADVVDRLLQDPRIEINKKDLYGNTALHFAAKAGCSASVDLLLKHAKINVNAVDHLGSTALISAATWDRSEIVEQLLVAGANPTLQDQDGGTALRRAIDLGNTAVVNILLEHDTVDDSIRDNTGRTLLHGAAATGRADVAKILIEQGLSINAQDSNGRTPLHEASRTGEAEVVSLLLAAGANRSIKDQWDRLPSDVAWTNRGAEAMLLLDNKPADEASVQALLTNYPNIGKLPIWSLTSFNRIDILESALKSRPNSLFHLDPDTDNTALHAAVLANTKLILKTLLSAGLSPDAQNKQSRTPLHLAVLLNSLPCTQILLAHSPLPNLNIRDEFHQTPLLIAQINAYYDIAFALIEAGAEIDREVIQVQALFFMAVEFSKPKAVRRLIAAGAVVGEKNVNGKTALGIARDNCVGMEEEMGEVLMVLRENRSRVVRRHEGDKRESYGVKGGEVDGEEEEEEDDDDDDRKFQMSAFRRRDIFDEEEETTRIQGIEEVEETATSARREAVLA
ncbi:MAG: hypothetical protein Q9166_006908 [cf. Caloplaca sp. 2 TL-2023]